MILTDLVNHACDKNRFHTLENYISFCAQYLEFIETGLQKRIDSQNEKHYQFFQYREEDGSNITRPINSRLMYDAKTFTSAAQQFIQLLKQLKRRTCPSETMRENMIRTIYTIQQSIGATLDALPAGRSNQARKVNGDLFERFIRSLITSLDIDCVSDTEPVSVKDQSGKVLFKSSYQHDLRIRRNGDLKIIGSVKTSSKDRIGKIFLDKFLYSKLTNTAPPHIAIFLNDVQRKKTKRETEYAISTTFLPGHFKEYTIALNPLDGVYYCDIFPDMRADPLLSQHIKTIDHFFYSDLWQLLGEPRQTLSEVEIEPDEAKNV